MKIIQDLCKIYVISFSYMNKIIVKRGNYGTSKWKSDF